MSFTPSPYTTKPIAVEAGQLTADNAEDVVTWCNGQIVQEGGQVIGIDLWTLSGEQRAEIDDWIIQDGEQFYPCTQALFAEWYDPA
jgi:hypothetical protein